MSLLVCQHCTVQACTKPLFYVGLYNELLIINFILSYMAMHMGLLMESLSGIFQKKCTKMKKLCDWYAILKIYEWNIINSCCSLIPVSLTGLKLLFETVSFVLWFISVCWVCIKICSWGTWQYILCWQCSNGSYGDWTNGFKCFTIQGA